MTRFAILFAALAMLATAVPAKAAYCHTSCTTIGNQQFCNTNCY